jgi:hypothetical protein
MKHALGMVGLAGFLMSLLVHAAALADIDVSRRVPAVWLLHVGIFVVFVPLVFSIRRQGTSTSTELLTVLPTWARFTAIVLFGYALINFAVFMFRTQGGNPTIHGGRYLLKSHGRLIREITPVEYAAFRANEVRGFSGHWMLFYFLPFSYFLAARKEPNQSLRPTAPSRRG